MIAVALAGEIGDLALRRRLDPRGLGLGLADQHLGMGLCLRHELGGVAARRRRPEPSPVRPPPAEPARRVRGRTWPGFGVGGTRLGLGDQLLGLGDRGLVPLAVLALGLLSGGGQRELEFRELLVGPGADLVEPGPASARICSMSRFAAPRSSSTSRRAVARSSVTSRSATVRTRVSSRSAVARFSAASCSMPARTVAASRCAVSTSAAASRWPTTWRRPPQPWSRR